jgi:uncharacterized protein
LEAGVKGWLSSRLPDRESLLSRRWLRPFAHRLSHPSIWHFNRWSVARGLALGLFCGFLIPLGQVVLAALFAFSLRANLIVAAAATLITNPFTFPAIYYGAYRVGSAFLADSWLMLDAHAAESLMLQRVAWLLNVSMPTALGLILFALVSSMVGYFGVQLAWRIYVARRWARRPRPVSPSRRSPSIG